MPHLGFYHDDGIYWLGAKSLAENDGYRILSLPGQPYQTKYPPVFPALLALVWKLNPTFPANLPLATVLVWLLLPPYLLLIRSLLKRFRFSPGEQVVLCLIAGLNPMCVLFSFALMPELLFTSLFLLSLLLADRFAAWSGFIAALAYLTKAAAMPLLLTVPLVFILRKRPKQAGAFALSMLPAVIAWQLWIWRHLSASQDPVTLYYTNYLGVQLHNVTLTNLPAMIWHNLDAFLTSIGKLLLFDVGFIGGKHVQRVVAVASIGGIVRLTRRTGNLQFPVAALGFSGLLLIWCYQPDERFVFPLYPLLLAGLWTEILNLTGALKISWAKQWPDRVAAAIGAAVLAAFAIFFAFTNAYGLTRTLPRLMRAYRSDLASRRPAYDWIARHTQESANVFAYDDPLLFLYTGRRSVSLAIPPRLIYYDERATDAMVRGIPEFAREHGLRYLLVRPDDFYRDLHQRGAGQLAIALQHNAAVERVFESPAASVYQLVPQPATITTNAFTPCDSARGLLRARLCPSEGGEEARHP